VTAPRSLARRALRPLALAGAGAAAYATTFDVPFVLDDVRAIVTNLRIRELGRAPLASPQPAVELTLALNYALGGLAVAGYHAVNLALHLACGLLLLDLVRRTLVLAGNAPRRAAAVAWWAALLFLLHPLQTEAVTYVGGRGELLAALCYLATLELCLLGEAHARWRAALWTAAIAACGLGMAAGPAMWTAPAAAIWLARCLLPRPEVARISFASERRGPRPADVPVRWPLWTGLAATWAVAALLIMRPGEPWAGRAAGTAPADYLATQLGVTWHYLRLLVWPVGQTLAYDWPLATDWRAASVGVPAAGWAALLGALAWLRARGARAAAFWLGLAILALVPTSSVIPLADLAAERRMYLSVGGFATLAALAGTRAGARVPRLAGALALAVAAALGLATFARNQLWRDPVALWQDALVKAPSEPRVFRNLARAYEERGDHAAAQRVAAAEAFALERLARRRPEDPRVLVALAHAYLRVDQPQHALAVTRQAVRIAPRDLAARAALGGVLLQLSGAREALAQLEIAQALADGGERAADPETLSAVLVNLGWAYASVGRTADAVRVLRRATARDDVGALNDLGSILARLGQWQEAVRVLERAHAKDPADPHVQASLGWVYANLGRLAEASTLLKAAIRRRPDDPSSHGSLGWVRLRAGKARGALHALAMAQALDPRNAWVANMQGVAHARLGNWPAAVASFRRALMLAPDMPEAWRNLEHALRQEQPRLPGEGPALY
jgi:tetratricopeptide (TPR) repeat protein